MFVTLRDGSGSIQLFVDRAVLGADGFTAFGELELGDWIGASGEVITTKRGELSVRVSDFVLLQPSLRPLPDKWHGLQDREQRSRRRYIDLMVNDDARRTALTRARVITELRRQFEARGTSRSRLRYSSPKRPVHWLVRSNASPRPRHGNEPSNRHRALPEASRCRRTGTGVRDRTDLSQRGRRFNAQSRVHDARVI